MRACVHGVGSFNGIHSGGVVAVTESGESWNRGGPSIVIRYLHNPSAVGGHQYRYIFGRPRNISLTDMFSFATAGATSYILKLE